MHSLTRTRPHIIGGMFGLGEIPDPMHSNPPFLKSNPIQLVNARSGLSLLIKLLSPEHVWMPSYFCGPVLKAVDERMAEVRLYEVDYDLTMPSSEWLDSVQPNDLVVVVDYFGFPCAQELKHLAKEQGAWVLEDACQALLSEDVGRFADFVLYSPRKFLGVPDGGILVCNHAIECSTFTMEPLPQKWWLKTFAASVLRREFDLHGGDRRWFELFQESEIEGPIGPYAMSELSQALLQHSFDYSKIAEARVKNYKMLAEGLGELGLFPFLPEGVVPLGFPIRIKNRDRVRHALFKHEIYLPVHWPIEGYVPEKFRESHRLASELVTLPCDQRYTDSDMKRIIRCVTEEMK